MATVPDDTPDVVELAWGADELAFGDDLLVWGGDPSTIAGATITRLKPEQIIVAACRSIMVQAFPVYQEGKAILPSVVFSANSVVEQEGFQRKLVRQTFNLVMRAATYSEVIMLTEDVLNALRKFPGNRFRGVSAMNDGYAEQFGFRTRIVQIVIER